MRLLGIQRNACGAVLGSAGGATLKSGQIQNPCWAQLCSWNQSRNFRFHEHPKLVWICSWNSCLLPHKQQLETPGNEQLFKSNRSFLPDPLHYEIFIPSSWGINTDGSLKASKSSASGKVATQRHQNSTMDLCVTDRLHVMLIWQDGHIFHQSCPSNTVWQDQKLSVPCWTGSNTEITAVINQVFQAFIRFLLQEKVH